MANPTEIIESIDALSDALWRDERVFSASERELLVEILKHARGNGAARTAESDAASRAIAGAVGEVIAQRLLSAVGGDIARRVADLLSSSNSAPAESSGQNGNGHSRMIAGPGPHPGPKGIALDFARPGPHPPGTNLERRGPGPHPGPSPTRSPKGPGPHPGPSPTRAPKGPGPHPGHRKHHRHHEAPGPHPKRREAPGPHPKGRSSSAAELAPQDGPPVVVLDEFLAPQELERLSSYVEAHVNDFELSEVISPGATAASVDFKHRRSRVLFELAEHEAVVSGRILSYLPRILPAVGLDPFPIAHVEAQITASNDGDYFRPHEDNGGPPLHTRELTFVYFFHREPKAFRGGELRIYDSSEANGNDASETTCRVIVPQQNQVVFFPSHLMHEITPVDCPSKSFLASRFTLNGWFHRPE